MKKIKSLILQQKKIIIGINDLDYFEKIFIQMIKNSTAKIRDYVIYYCHFHFTTIDSTKFTEKGNKKKFPKYMKKISIIF